MVRRSFSLESVPKSLLKVSRCQVQSCWILKEMHVNQVFKIAAGLRLNFKRHVYARKKHYKNNNSQRTYVSNIYSKHAPKFVCLQVGVCCLL